MVVWAQRWIMKIYFALFGQVYSMNKTDAINMATNAVLTGSYDLRNYKHTMLKGRTNRRENGTMKINDKYVTVHHCLDWKNEDWEYFLQSLR